MGTAHLFAGQAAEVEFTVPPPRKLVNPAAKGITIYIREDVVKDLRQFEERPAAPDIPVFESPQVPQNRCMGMAGARAWRSGNILIAGTQTVESLVADTLANALTGMEFRVVRAKAQAPGDAVHAAILIDRFWGWWQGNEKGALGGGDGTSDISDMVGEMQTRIILSRPGGKSITVAVTGDGRVGQGMSDTVAWQRMMNRMLQSYMKRAQARIAEVDFTALSPSTVAIPDEKEQLRRLENLRDEKLITEEEYRQKHKEILNRL